MGRETNKHRFGAIFFLYKVLKLFENLGIDFRILNLSILISTFEGTLFFLLKF